MANPTTETNTELVAALNDLLKLDHDAVQAYSLAIRLLKNEQYRESLERYRADHERHVGDLTSLIRNFGGTPTQLPHLPTGPFKLAVQGVGAAAGDRGVLLAFKANERQVRDKYRRMAESAHPPEVAAVLSRNAGDEEIHYGWALQTLEDLGAGESTTIGRAEKAFEVGHARAADAMESGERRVVSAARKAKENVGRTLRDHPVRAAVVALGAGLIATRLFRR